jgi:hypothetical protein
MFHLARDREIRDIVWPDGTDIGRAFRAEVAQGSLPYGESSVWVAQAA